MRNADAPDPLVTLAQPHASRQTTNDDRLSHLRHDPESPMFLDRFVPFLHAPDIRPPRPVTQLPAQLLEFLFRPYRVHFHAAVIQITGIARQSQAGRRPLREVPKPNTLHAPAYDPSPRSFVIATHPAKSISRAVGRPARSSHLHPPRILT